MRHHAARMSAKPSSQAGLWWAGVVVAVVVVAVGWLRGPDGSSPTDASSDGVAATGAGPAPSGDDPGDVAPSHACSTDERARVAGLEPGTTLATEWRLDAITCHDGEPCTRLGFSHAEERLVIRVCAHVEGAPLPPTTVHGLDVFFDLPRSDVGDARVRALVEAVAATLGAS